MAPRHVLARHFVARTHRAALVGTIRRDPGEHLIERGLRPVLGREPGQPIGASARRADAALHAHDDIGVEREAGDRVGRQARSSAAGAPART